MRRGNTSSSLEEPIPRQTSKRDPLSPAPAAQGGVMSGGMAAEGTVGTYPQVFVVDSQANYAPLARGRSPRWGGVCQKLLPFLVGVALFGLAIQACCIFYLYNKTKDLHVIARNQDSSVLERTGSQEANEIPVKMRTRPPERLRKPSAHLTEPSWPLPKGECEVQWAMPSPNNGDAFTHLMDYKDGRLLVKEEGHYFIYSKVHFNVQNGSFFSHMVWKVTESYNKIPQMLMKAKSLFPSYHRSPVTVKDPGNSNSFLGGVFHLTPGDHVYVTINNGSLLLPGSKRKQNFMGLFMI